MHTGFSRKLHLTAVALGCTTRKALCARFRLVNPATVCDIDRLHKWMQGRAMPRDRQFFEDWRLVIGSERHAAWIEASSVEAFAEELAQGAGMTVGDLWLREQAQRRQTDAAPAVLGAQRTLYGVFACYSHAWSPRHRGMLIRGSLRIGPGSRQGLQAIYTESLISGSIRLSGDVVLSGGLMHVVLTDGTNGLPLFLSIIAPGPPASVLCGMLAGPALIAHVAMPSASRFVAVRLPDDGGLDASNRYIDRDPAVVSGDLVAAGLRMPDADQAAAGLLAFLGAGAHQVAVADHLALCDLLDGVQPNGFNGA